MKAGWERSHELIMPELETVRNLAFFKHKEVHKISPLSGGLNNSNIKVTTDDGVNYVLRIYSRNKTSLHIERELIKGFSGEIPVPQVLYFDDSCTDLEHPFLIMSWVDGVQLSELMYQQNKERIVTAARDVGMYLAKIHQVKFPQSGFFDEQLYIQETVEFGSDLFLSLIEEMLINGHADRHIGRDLCNEVLHFCQNHAHLMDEPGEQSTLVHSDFNPLNILVDQTGAVTGILDWEYAMSGSPMMDIGNMLRYEKVSDSTFMSPFLSSYVAHGGYLPEKWLQKAKLHDLVALSGLVNKEECGEARIADIKRLILQTMEEWDLYEDVQK
ncbi:phosphotransferase family protein [Pseudalkalibacillus berkeleyi]|uniref:Aminoglycoside phosphotransferase family protein n=1 Tax=Pseudalkalibacillus berkeleyi TaxID=1069813 RepID=A0ABS9H540_9BACL|nr:aminoglycoside phosphotransferase family protein [Pseudalkalibacillus berkeleyi]MCF6139196.1 aminoglycoside phosphotransferase family protein [Pseudalkalibacillus berkeleyi]